jgi:ribosomal protein L2
VREESGTSNFVGNMSVGTLLHGIETSPGKGG